jgi:rRNA maturation RNase YbeY
MTRLRVEVFKAVRAPVAPAFLRSVLTAAVEEPAVTSAAGAEAQLSVRVTGDRELRRLNREFLGEDHATDVLSFPSGDPDGSYLGDVALSWPAVSRQASAFGHPWDVEAALLVVHGLLHLLGWDHASPSEEREMAAVTLACLARSGLRPAPGRL